MQTIHETLLVISIIDSFCAQLKLFCETFISSEYFQVVWENTNFNLKIFGRVLTIQQYFMKIVMFWKIWEFIQMCNVLNCTIFSIYRISFAENHSLMRSTKFEPISFVSKKKSQYLETIKGVVTNINIFTKSSILSENILRQIIIKMHSKIHEINHYSKMP